METLRNIPVLKHPFAKGAFYAKLRRRHAMRGWLSAPDQPAVAFRGISQGKEAFPDACI